MKAYLSVSEKHHILIIYNTFLRQMDITVCVWVYVNVAVQAFEFLPPAARSDFSAAIMLSDSCSYSYQYKNKKA
jgi:hypothetical protein